MRRFAIMTMTGTSVGLALMLGACGSREPASQLKTEVGEKQDYDMDDSQTSDVVQDLDLDVKIKGERGNKWVVKVKYMIKAFWKEREGTQTEKILKRYLTEDFRETLREAKVIRTPKARVTHLKYNGRCDKVKLDDLRMDTDPIDDPVIKLKICPGIPAIGAKWIRADGEFEGYNVEIGLER